MPNRVSPLRRLWHFVSRQVVDNTPEDVALCEFDCRKQQCMHEEWSTCERRIGKGRGELFPPSKPSSSDAGR